ncbi:hypothetical protein C1X05_05615 [Laceyella sacchari]|nr:hypothetical protein C1X05_05615 [Laceyella sacchari]
MHFPNLIKTHFHTKKFNTKNLYIFFTQTPSLHCYLFSPYTSRFTLALTTYRKRTPGKSTIIQLLAERFPKGDHVCKDTFRRMINKYFTLVCRLLKGGPV